MTTPNRDSQSPGTTTGSGTVTSQYSEVRDRIQTPTDFLNFFRDLVGDAQRRGVSQQQLLDSISDHYRGTSNSR